MNDLTPFDGWKLDTTTVSEPRVRDIEIAIRAGHAKPRNVRQVIERHWSELSRHGEIRVCRSGGQTSKGGRPGNEYRLNEAQCYALMHWLDTPMAESARVAMVQLFVAYRRGQLATTVTASAPMQARIGDDPRAMSLVRTYCQVAARQSGLSVHRIQGRIRKPWGVMSIYRIALSSLDHTIAQLKEIIEAPRPKQLPADRRQVSMPWSAN